ncbi:MAG: 2-dehydropantoate 2-reductase [Myxococcota bacterium]
MSEEEPRTLVVGLGGIGGIVTAHLLEQEQNITPLTTNPGIAEAIEKNGYEIHEDGESRTVRGKVVRALPEDTEPFDFILLATQPPQVEAAASSVAKHLAPGGLMVCFQNGLCEDRVAPIVGKDRVIGGIIAWGASMLGPGRYERTSSGGFTIGRLDGGYDARLERLAILLESIGPVEITDNLLGARYSKLAINCAISSLGAIGGDRLGALLAHRFVRRLALEIMTEVVEVAKKEGVRLEKVSGTLDLDWIALTPVERKQTASAALVSKHGLLLAVGARYRRLRSSMLSALERGRPPAVDFLNGEVVTRSLKHGLSAPINEAVRQKVHAIARGEARSSLETLRSVYDETRGA